MEESEHETLNKIRFNFLKHFIKIIVYTVDASCLIFIRENPSNSNNKQCKVTEHIRRCHKAMQI